MGHLTVLAVMAVLALAGLAVGGIQRTDRRALTAAVLPALKQVDRHTWRGLIRGVHVKVTQAVDEGLHPERPVAELRPARPIPRLSFTSRDLLGLADTLFAPGSSVDDAVIDAQFRVLGDRRLGADLLADPQVQSAVRACGALRCDNGVIQARAPVDSGRLQPWVDRLVDLVVALERARRRGWTDVAIAHDLEVDGACSRLTGAIDGYAVRIEEVPHQGVVRTEIRVRFESPLPNGTALRARGRGVDLRDPILDGQICARGDVDWLRERLCTEEGRAAAMGVVHAYPESDIDEDRILLRAEGRLMADLNPAVTDCLALARVLTR